MTLKYLLITIIFILLIKNYNFVNIYVNRYLIKDIQPFDEKSKCFEYYNQKDVYDKNLETEMDIKCVRYSHQYVLFVLDRAQFVNNYVKFNAIFICIICTIIIYKYCIMV